MPHLHLAELSLLQKPRLVVAFDRHAKLAQVQAAQQQGMDFAELRFDLGGLQPLDVLQASLSAFTTVPRLLTLRHEREGGEWRASESRRVQYYRALLPAVDGIDVELSATGAAEIIQFTHAAQKCVVLSAHDFQNTPSMNELNDKMARAHELGADIFKIAAMVNTQSDLHRLARFLCQENSKLPLVVIGMGALARNSRVIFPALGSVFSFAALDVQTAPGQWALNEMLPVFRGLYG